MRYKIEIFGYSERHGKWLFDQEIYLDPRNIIWFRWDGGEYSERWGELVRLTLEGGYNYNFKTGKFYYEDYNIWVKYSVAKQLWKLSRE